MKTVRQLIAPLEANEFFKKYWSRRFLLVAGDSNKLAEVFSFDAFGQLVRTYGNLLSYPRVTLYSDGNMIHESRFTFGSDLRISGALGYREEERVDFDRVQRLLANGASLKISEVDAFSDSICKLVTSLTEELHEKIHVNLYYSAPRSRAFGDHFDKHDVFILQIAGSKNWQIFEYQEPFPIPGMKKSREVHYRNAAKQDFSLSAGDCLYLPRGMWHNAFTTGSDSLHLTVGIQCATGIDLMHWAVERLVCVEQFRRNLSLERNALGQSLKQTFVNEVHAILSNETVWTEFYQSWTRRPKDVLNPSFLSSK